MPEVRRRVPPPYDNGLTSLQLREQSGTPMSRERMNNARLLDNGTRILMGEGGFKRNLSIDGPQLPPLPQ